MNALIAGLPIGAALAPGYQFGNSTTDHIATVNGVFLQFQGFSSGQDAFLGFQFEISGGTHYAWARVNVTTGSAGVAGFMNIVEWAYEDTPGAAIDTGAVPEPNSITGIYLLACGAAGLRRWRKRNSQNSKLNRASSSDRFS